MAIDKIKIGGGTSLHKLVDTGGLHKVKSVVVATGGNIGEVNGTRLKVIMNGDDFLAVADMSSEMVDAITEERARFGVVRAPAAAAS